MDDIKKLIDDAIQICFGISINHQVVRTDQKFGDFSSNAALKLAPQLKKNPQQVARLLVEQLKKNDNLTHVDIAGPGFINTTLSDRSLVKLANSSFSRQLQDKEIVVEYSDPNPFKVLHAGHLYTSIVGDSIANLLEQAGANVHRVNYRGDVGLHVGKTMWAILDDLGGEYPEKLNKIDNKAEWLSSCYIKGTAAFEQDLQARETIIALNKKIYQVHKDNDRDSNFAQIYWTCRQWSYEYFNEFYSRIGSRFEKYYSESTVTETGLAKIREQLGKGVYEKSKDAVIFNGEKYGLHTRVFINSEGLPTYETKEVGLIFKKKQDYNYDYSVVITGSEQKEYMEVVLKSVEQYASNLVRSTKHITHGLVKLTGGEKMSSRKGNILRAQDVLNTAQDAAKEVHNDHNFDTVLAAVKYSFLKQRLGGDIVFDPKESVSMQGNSGPYLQYAYARGCSILAKSSKKSQDITNLDKNERTLLRKISEYNEVKFKTLQDLMPHHICSYLYELAQAFNRFYEKNRIIDNEREAIRRSIVEQYVSSLADGLSLLGISAPKKM